MEIDRTTENDVQGGNLAQIEEEVSEAMTPAEAILRSSAVNPDLDKALALVNTTNKQRCKPV